MHAPETLLSSKSIRSLGVLFTAGMMMNVPVFAEELVNDDARMAKKLANKIEPIVNVPVQFNFYQKAGPQHQQYQEKIILEPVIPVPMTQDWNLLLRPLVTANLQYQAGTANNQTSPIQLEAFLSPSAKSDLSWGIGPYFQSPGTGLSNGSDQYGAGVSAAAFYKPGHWVLGVISYNSWAVGGPTSSGTANVFYAAPQISYITENAWTWTAMMQPTFNYNSRNASNPLLLLGAKTTKIFGVPVQVQAGPSYMVSTTSTSGQGLGFRVQLTAAMPE
jgi:hypothetical protein